MTELRNVNATIVTDPVLVGGYTKTDRYTLGIDELGDSQPQRIVLDRAGELQVGSGEYSSVTYTTTLATGDTNAYNILPAGGGKYRIYGMYVTAVGVAGGTQGFFLNDTGAATPFNYTWWDFTDGRNFTSTVPMQLGFIELPDGQGLDFVGLGGTGSATWYVNVWYRTVSY